MNSGILTAAHNDRNDGYGGVIVINKKHLIIEDNHFKFTGGNIVSIKIETLKKKQLYFVLVTDHQIMVLLQMTVSSVTCWLFGKNTKVIQFEGVDTLIFQMLAGLATIL